MSAQILPASFSSTSLKFDLSMDARMGRKMIGLFGRGGIEIRPEGLSFQGRCHEYKTNLIGGAVAAIALFVLVFIAGDPEMRRNAFGGAMLGFIIGGWLTSLVARFRAPRMVHVERASIERVLLRGPVVRICTRGGDVQLTTDQNTYAGLMQALQHWGIPATSF